jgi:membrane protein YqaA with SNARE-associated domain
MPDESYPDEADDDRVFNAETRRALRRAGRETFRLGTLIVVFVLLCITGYALTGIAGVADAPIRSFVLMTAYIGGGMLALRTLATRDSQSRGSP